MNYEHKDALDRARNLHKDAIDMGAKDVIKICEIIFPELAESEDERIKRNIIAALKGEGYFDCDLTNECIAWVKKQGEQKHSDNSIDAFIDKAWDYISRHQLEYNDYDDFKSHMKGE